MKLFHLLLFIFSISIVRMSAQASLQQAAEQLASHASFKHGRLAICVMDIQSGDILARHDEEQSMIPASTLKLVTTATALSLLGKDFRFTTVVEHSGQIDADGTLNGSLYIKGYGDPTLGADLLESAHSLDATLDLLALAVQRAGITAIKGQIIGDATAYESAANGRTWQWEDMGNYYGAGLWALNFHENLHYLHFQQERSLGRRPEVVAVEPEVPGLRFNNELKTGPANSGDQAYIFGAPYQYERYIRGTIPSGSGLFTIKGSIPNPPLWCAQLLAQRLWSIGIESAGAASIISAPQRGNRTVLYTHYSPPLHEIVARANGKSVNLYCEAMLKRIGYTKSQKGSTETGVEKLQSYWAGQGINFSGVQMTDGSGLSEGNRVTALFMARFLRAMAQKSTFGPFYQSIPVAGRSGSMKNRLKGTAADGRLSAKSGTLEGVRAFAGYAKRPDGRLLAYAVMANDYQGSGGQMRQLLEQYLLKLCQ
jgi:D-alanyl-D-alanine carboxypeptidase/D-alanyl-D-alanine-endopeptidase (penicillin-binding protein 4)